MANMDDEVEIPIFPLNTVLFPGGALPLRIFESRYLDMVTQCMKQDSGFGICLIREGKEVGQAARVHDYGTFGTISYFQNLPDGLLGITVRGEQRFEVLSTYVEPNQLTMARVRFVDNETAMAIPAQYRRVSDILCDMIQQLGPPYSTLPADYDDAVWVSNRLAELLPLEVSLKQMLLQENDPVKRLSRIHDILIASNY
jgi:Lon protease-like protein